MLYLQNGTQMNNHLTIKDFQGEVYSGKVMQLIKQTLENIRLGKQQQTNGEKKCNNTKHGYKQHKQMKK